MGGGGGGGGGLAGCKTPTDCVMSGECMADAPCLCKNGKCKNDHPASAECKTEDDCKCMADASCLCKNGKCESSAEGLFFN